MTHRTFEHTDEEDSPRVWFITGSSSGFGRALTEEVLRGGGRVAATARMPEKVQDLEQKYPDNARAIRLDVTHSEEASAAVKKTREFFGRIDVVVNNAGYGLFGALEEFSKAEVRQQFETNVFGVLNVTRAALPLLRSQRKGHIVQMSSLSGVAPSAGEGAYAGTKFAVEGISESLAKEVAHLGIRVTIVEPGPFRTDFAGRSAKTKDVESQDYNETVGKALEWFQDLSGTQTGDPEKAARAIIEAVQADEPPLHLPLGEVALQAIRQKLDERRQELEAWEQLGTAMDFDAT